MLMPVVFIASALVQFALGLAVAWLLGPEEFGHYALALAASVLAQTLLFEWLRLAAIRFHEIGAPGAVAATIRLAFRRTALLALAGALLLLLLPHPLRTLLAFVPAIATAAGYAELRAAMMRAEFDEAGYAFIVAIRNVAAILAMPAGAILTGSAEGVLAGFLAAIIVAIAFDAVRRLVRPAAPTNATAEEGPGLLALLAYSGPIILTNVIYNALFLGLRAGVAATGGMVAAGQFSLAFDFVAKLFTTVGTACDLLLFQLAVRADRQYGPEAGEARLQANLLALLAILAPMILGLVLVLPSIEALLVAPAYRGAFRGYALALVPGIALYALVQYALHPFFQLRRNTAHLPVAAAACGVLAPAFFIAFAALEIGPSWQVGLPLLGGMLAAAGALLRVTSLAPLPGSADITRIGLSLVGLWAGALPGLMLPAGLTSLALAAMGGMIGYALAAVALDLGGARDLFRARWSRP